jgi:hypothetical protein
MALSACIILHQASVLTRQHLRKFLWPRAGHYSMIHRSLKYKALSVRTLGTSKPILIALILKHPLLRFFFFLPWVHSSPRDFALFTFWLFGGIGGFAKPRRVYTIACYVVSTLSCNFLIVNLLSQVSFWQQSLQHALSGIADYRCLIFIDLPCSHVPWGTAWFNANVILRHLIGRSEPWNRWLAWWLCPWIMDRV